MKSKFILIVLSLWFVTAQAQLEHEVTGYVWPTDPLVLEKLDQWQDMKFGLLMHWGAYSQWGIVESWSICPEDYGWCERRKGSNPNDYNTYLKEYENLKLSFNPVGFEPERWAEAANRAGMKYVVFTTKHHDGFSMFDSKYTDYKVTDPACPFHVNPKANITKEIFDAFREKGLWAGAYFSKPDWNSDHYWDPYFPPLDRNVNYDPELYPEKWEKFVDFTHNQILELMTDYGKVDILWLDGGWVSKKSPEQVKASYERRTEGIASGFLKNRSVNQDIRMDELAAKARVKQPGLIVVDRAVEGPNQNYLTPENTVPGEMLPYPWESCIIAGGGWSWVPDAAFMTPRKAIHMLVDIVAKGGNLLYNIAPGPDGKWPEGAYSLLEAMGKWIDVNGEAIYSTRAVAPYKSGNICFTQNKTTKSVYAIYLPQENEKSLPSEVIVEGITPAQGTKVELLGVSGSLKWQKTATGFKIFVPTKLQNSPPCGEAWSFKIHTIK
ncbi:MAG: alpha-L-fucosidase [Prolixibacteraceae bacterium]|nr:alpha-L-fucosidase [Prolixibacteraceae bacterium]